MTSKLLLLCGFLVIWTSQSCKNVEKTDNVNKAESQNLKNAQVEECVVEKMDPDSGSVIVSIKGILPNPSYKIEHVDVKVEKNIITLTPKMSHDPSLTVIQMTIPFEEKVSLSDLTEKSYIIEIIGDNKVVAQELKW